MYCNFTKCNVLPSAIRVSAKPFCSKSFSHSHKFPAASRLTSFKTHGSSLGVRFITNGFCSKTVFVDCGFVKVRNFSSMKNEGDRNVELGRSGVGTSLPWLAAQKAKEVKRVEKTAIRNSWEESAERLQGANSISIRSRSTTWEESAEQLEGTKVRTSSWEDSAERLEGVKSTKVRTSSWEESAKRLEGVKSTKVRTSSWEESAERLEGGNSSRFERNSVEDSGDRLRRRSDISLDENRGRRDVWTAGSDRRQRSDMKSSGRSGEEDEELGGDEVVDDPRWDRIKSRVGSYSSARRGYEKPELQSWNRQENWGRKTLREATESSVPRMTGEGIYGVGPVLAALSAGRREFYALHVQEGLDLSSNNRKKKDKKGFEKVLKMAEKIGLSIKETSKHDLNMVVDNRPHQGLVLDASPLDMVKIRELDPVSEDENGSLWLALDEVTDPQNLGAIIRSAYFFGASGVVLCAKNSAPLSGVVSKASAGSLELMELRSCKNMMQFLTSSSENGWRVLGGSVSSRAVPLKDISPGAPTILVLGSEGTGLRPLVERSCTQLVKIPGNIPIDVSTTEEYNDAESGEMDHGRSGEEFRSFMAVESLNVSVAAGVLLHHLVGDYHTDSHITDNHIDADSSV